jgi:hypothetical protein
LKLRINDDPEEIEVGDETWDKIVEAAGIRDITVEQFIEDSLRSFVRDSVKSMTEYAEWVEAWDRGEADSPFDKVVVITDETGKDVAVSLPWSVWNGIQRATQDGGAGEEGQRDGGTEGSTEGSAGGEEA